MPLVPDAIYAIRNDLTHTVLDFTGNENQNFVLGWGWHGGYNQKWKLIRVGDPNDNNWQLQNQLLRANQRRFLSRQANAAHRLVGEVANANATFVIERIAGPSERYRILHDGQAVTLITGGGAEAAAHNILPAHQVLDLHADGPPIALQARDNANRAQIWSFLPIAQLPVENGIYRIVNETGLVLDLTAGNDAGLVQGLESQQTWIVAKDQNSEYYRFESSSFAGRFLATPPGPPGNNTTLTTRAQAARFNIRNVPGTQLYKIFFDPLAVTNNVSGLAVNLVGGAVRLQAAVAQTWSFV